MLINKSLAKNVSRREFLQKSGMAALALGGGLTFSALTEGCATLTFKEEAPVIYPPLKGHKVQPPQDGCLFGVRTVYNDVKRRAPDIPRDTTAFIDYFTKELDQEPAIWAIQRDVGVHRGLMYMARKAADKGIIPFVFTGWPPERVLEGDFRLRRMSRNARKLGEQYGGFFITSMWEMNMRGVYNPYPWGGKPSQFKKAWRKIWSIFEDAGANEYATWIIEYHAGFPLQGYYPGDEYVDWIGVSCYNSKVNQEYHGYRQLSHILSPSPYRYFRVKHPNKPFILAEFGSQIGRDQPSWLRKALGTIKSLPGMKAAICWDVFDHNIGADMTLSEESIKVLREVLKDPYFI